MNNRIEALAGKPDFKETEAIKEIVNSLMSEIADVRNSGEKALAEKDKEISHLELQVRNLNAQREDEISNAMSIAQVNARERDQYKATLNQMDSWFGLGAIFYGAKRLIVSAAWILGIGGALFIVLRFASNTNPIAKSIFSIFETIGSWFVHLIKGVVGTKAVEGANYVASDRFDAYKKTLYKLIDCVETLRNEQKRMVADALASNKPADDVFTVDELMDDLSKTMGDSDKKLITDIKHDNL